MKQASIALVVSCLLAGCGNATPIAAPPKPAGSPVAEVEASAPVVHGVQAPPNSGVPAPSASAAPQPTSTLGPDTVRMTAAAGSWQPVSPTSGPSMPPRDHEGGRR